MQRWNRNQVYSNITQRLQRYTGASIKINCEPGLGATVTPVLVQCIHSVGTAKLLLIDTPFRGVGRKFFGGFPKWCKQNSRAGSGEHSSPDNEGNIPFLYYFCGIFTMLLSNNDGHK